MQKTLLSTQQDSDFKIKKDTVVFDANSEKAHIIARNILSSQHQYGFDLLPQQNARYFGSFQNKTSTNVAIKQGFSKVGISIIKQDGSVLAEKDALRFINKKITNTLH